MSELDQWRRFMRDFTRRVSDLGPVLREIGEEGIADSVTNVRRAETPTERPWAELRPNTVLNKARLGKTRPGIMSGQMLRLLMKVDVGAAVVHWGTNVLHGAYFHKGTKKHPIEAKRRKTLAWFGAGGWHFPRAVEHPGQVGREWVGIGPRLERLISKILHRHIDEAARRGGSA